MLMLDIDHFKDFNDTHGHLAGDECLKMVAAIIQNALNRTSDMAFRYGGEEFTVLLPDTRLRGAFLVAEKIRRQTEAAHLPCDDRNVSVTISIGLVSAIPSIGLRPEDLLARADAALYQAKQEGRNRVVVDKTGNQDTHTD
jgi:diguanylate cyclase